VDELILILLSTYDLVSGINYIVICVVVLNVEPHLLRVISVGVYQQCVYKYAGSQLNADSPQNRQIASINLRVLLHLSSMASGRVACVAGRTLTRT
jgi:hypothetical protein